MRRGSTSTSRALAEQATAAEQVSREAVRMGTLISTVNRSMAEQSSASSEIAIAADSLRQQTDQAARAMVEQARAMKDLTTGSQNISKQIGMITKTNVEHSAQAEEVAASLNRVREVAEENSADAESLRAITETLMGGAPSSGSSRRNGTKPHQTQSNGHEAPRTLVRRNGRQ
jgi:methyl-accepting chemotaxis protein